MKRGSVLAKFSLEKDMSRYARNWLAGLGLIVKEEFYTPWGICDLVGASFISRRVRQRLSLGQRRSIGPPSRIELLNRIPESSTGKAITVKRLQREFGDTLTAKDLEKELKRLADGRFLRTIKRGHLQRLDGWFPLHKRIVALELKLSRIDDALHQARAHFRFAEESYVGFPDDLAVRVVRSNRAARFEQSGVGIVSIGVQGCNILLRSKRQKRLVDLVLQMHCIERFWRTMPTEN